MPRLLERAGYRVLAAPSGAEALKLLKERRRAVQLVVSDVRMPEMGGVELVSQLLAAGIDLPVLFMSGQLDAPLPTNWPRTMPRRFLAKPFTLEQLSKALEEAAAMHCPEMADVAQLISEPFRAGAAGKTPPAVPAA